VNCGAVRNLDGATVHDFKVDEGVLHAAVQRGRSSDTDDVKCVRRAGLFVVLWWTVLSTFTVILVVLCFQARAVRHLLVGCGR
jgi:hypothetical protein